jgi:ABC-type glutathione transport system ATPase component
VLEIKNLSVESKKHINLLNDICFSLQYGESIGLTGQSGAGKTTLIKAVMGILGKTCRVKEGDILLDGLGLTALSSSRKRDLCGTTLGYIPQNPMTAFDRRIKIGKQIIETFRMRLRLSKEEAYHLALEKLQMVNLDDTSRVMESYPLQLSGGMLQRVSMAILLGLKPKYILADEPTSALDEDNRDMILDLLMNQMNDSGILMISHDVFALESLCEMILVMERGRIIEGGPMEKLLLSPKQEWTKKFSAANIKLDRRKWEWMEY